MAGPDLWSATEHGDPAPFHLAGEDKQRLLTDVPYLNLHPHLPHYERLGAGETALEVLVRQVVDPGAPPHPVVPPGSLFDSVLQARPEAELGRNTGGPETSVAYSALGSLALWKTSRAA